MGRFSFAPDSLTVTLSQRAPRQIIAGDSIEFLVQVPGDYTTWTGSARLTGPSTMDASSVVTEANNYHITFHGQSTPGTKSLTAGQYQLTVWATSGTDRKTIAQFPITITTDLSTGTPALAHAIEMLTAIEAAINARITGNTEGGVEEYAIEGTQVKKLSMMDLQKLRNKYAAEVQALQNPNGPLPRVKFGMTQAATITDFRRRFG